MQELRRVDHVNVAAEGTEHDRAVLAGLRVLIVDADPDLRDVLRALFEASAAIAYTAATSAVALQVLRQCDVDLMVADTEMPGESDTALIHGVRSLRRCARLPALALTASCALTARARLLGAGFSSYMLKPVEFHALVGTLLELVPGARVIVNP